MRNCYKKQEGKVDRTLLNLAFTLSIYSILEHPPTFTLPLSEEGQTCKEHYDANKEDIIQNANTDIYGRHIFDHPSGLKCKLHRNP